MRIDPKKWGMTCYAVSKETHRELTGSRGRGENVENKFYYGFSGKE